MKATLRLIGTALVALLVLGGAVAQAPTIPVTTSSPAARADFFAGRNHLENDRTNQGIRRLKGALSRDPRFALARAYLASVTPGPEGATLMHQALGGAAHLPVAERLVVELLAAEQQGDLPESRRLAGLLVDHVPGDWRAHYLAGEAALMARDLPAARRAFEDAARLAPRSGPVANLVGYVALMQGDKDQAIAAFRHYAKLAPTEPNPEDSLGEALLAEGDLDRAEAAFRRAAAIDPGFSMAWTGIAQTHALRGDFSGARKILETGRSKATRVEDRMALDDFLAWTFAADGKYVAATHLLERVAATARQRGQTVAEVKAHLDRAAIEALNGENPTAIKTVTATLKTANVLHLPKADRLRLRAQGFEVEAFAQANQSKPGDVTGTVSEVEAIETMLPGDPTVASAVTYVKGEARFAGAEYKGAAETFSACLPEASFCHARQVLALREAGDTKGAAAAQKTLLETPRRTTEYLIARAILGTLPKTTASVSEPE